MGERHEHQPALLAVECEADKTFSTPVTQATLVIGSPVLLVQLLYRKRLFFTKQWQSS